VGDSKTSAIDPTQARTHALNVEGVFFQQRVADVVQEAGWTITAQEHPVAFPKGNGPFPGREGRLDIRAERGSQGYRIILAIECKKSDQSYKDWVFFPDRSEEIRAPVAYPVLTSETPGSTTAGSKWRLSTEIRPFTAGVVCIDARELKAEFGKPDSWKSSTKRIEDACYQATQAVQALFGDIVERQNHLLAAGMEPEVGAWVIPLVVTTANLFLCRFTPKAVSLDTGEVDWMRVRYEPVDATVLEYPLPVHLQLPPAEPLKTDPRTVTKKHVFVVRGASLYVFLQRADLGVRP